jgi:DNA-binding FrmR family transcriptional regulator
MNGYSGNKGDIQKRLRRIEGQVRGLQKMVDEDRYCIDVLAQVASATKALEGVAIALFDDHLRHCVADAVSAGGLEADRKLTEACAAVARLLKS